MRPWLRNVLVTALMLALIGVFLRNANLAEVWRVVRDARWPLVGAGVLCLFTSYALRAVRWQLMLAPLGRTHFGPALRATVIGFAASFILPARAGEVIRPWLLARREGLDAAAVFATVVIERMLDLVAVLLLLGTFLLVFDPGLSAIDPALFAAVRAGGMAAAVAAVVGVGVLAACAARPELLTRAVRAATAWLPRRMADAVSTLAAAFVGGLAVVRDPWRIAWAVAWSIPLWVVIAAQIWVVSLAVGVALPWSGSLLIMAMLVVGVAVPTPGAVGGFHEAYRLGATTFFGVENDHAVGAAIVLHAVGFVPTLIAGAWLMAGEGLSMTHLGGAVQRARDEETRR
ncbi:MAG: lysylphosphatidylglycerol synthase transmembrane domain-containing protein [Vicinamibacterales bacterium]